jgi:hypothetical protein
MKKLYILPVLLIALSLLLVACGGSAIPAAQAAPKTTIKMQSNPNPAKAGAIELNFMITDQNGASLEGAKVMVNANHPTMSGMSMNGAPTEQGGGKYAIKANFKDSGTWKIMLEISKGDLNDKQELNLEIK